MSLLNRWVLATRPESLFINCCDDDAILDEIQRTPEIPSYLQDESFYVVHFCFGKDGDREYLDYYFDERRTGPSHVRLYRGWGRETVASLSYGLFIFG